MRGAASLGYLLARTSDTLADTAEIPIALRLGCLANFSDALSSGTAPSWPAEILRSIQDPRERALMASTEVFFAWLARVPESEAQLIREVASIIISGQTLDLERFGAADHRQLVALNHDAELEDYAWRVAGCVGVFWTKLGLLTLGERFSKRDVAWLTARASAYGKGLQLVNILRDLRADFKNGRCYLPLATPSDQELLQLERERWLARAEGWVSEGFAYSETLVSRRLRAASVLPAMLAMETLAALRRSPLDVRVKIPRSFVYSSVLRALVNRRFP